MPWLGLQCVIVIFPGYTHTLFVLGKTHLFDEPVYLVLIAYARIPLINAHDDLSKVAKTQPSSTSILYLCKQ